MLHAEAIIKRIRYHGEGTVMIVLHDYSIIRLFDTDIEAIFKFTLYRLCLDIAKTLRKHCRKYVSTLYRCCINPVSMLYHSCTEFVRRLKSLLFGFIEMINLRLAHL